MNKVTQLVLNLLVIAVTVLGDIEVCHRNKIKDCNKIYYSNFCPDGTISSPCYPSFYPNETTCNYEFIGSENERIQLNFIDFSLTGNDTECYYSDTIEIFTFAKGKYQPVQLLCNNRISNPIMSNNNRMKVHFRAIYGGERENSRGFELNFAFVKNFGINSGEQFDNKCDFNYNSNHSKTGTLSSPNHPGIYPSNMECNYLFYGNDNETIEILFTHFDVEGVFPCYGDEISSDSVEFSNYATRDRKLRFYCGRIDHTFKLVSDGKFFRVTFRSNDKLEGTGFNATYKFKGLGVIKNRTQFIELNIENSCIKLKNLSLIILMNVIFNLMIIAACFTRVDHF